MHSICEAVGGRWIALCRGAEISCHDTEQEAAEAAAADAIEAETDLVFDVAANAGQMVGNVKHMRWFLKAVADEIEREV